MLRCGPFAIPKAVPLYRRAIDDCPYCEASRAICQSIGGTLFRLKKVDGAIPVHPLKARRNARSSEKLRRWATEAIVTSLSDSRRSAAVRSENALSSS